MTPVTDLGNKVKMGIKIFRGHCSTIFEELNFKLEVFGSNPIRNFFFFFKFFVGICLALGKGTHCGLLDIIFNIFFGHLFTLTLQFCSIRLNPIFLCLTQSLTDESDLIGLISFKLNLKVLLFK